MVGEVLLVMGLILPIVLWVHMMILSLFLWMSILNIRREIYTRQVAIVAYAVIQRWIFWKNHQAVEEQRRNQLLELRLQTFLKCRQLEQWIWLNCTRSAHLRRWMKQKLVIKTTVRYDFYRLIWMVRWDEPISHFQITIRQAMLQSITLLRRCWMIRILKQAKIHIWH